MDSASVILIDCDGCLTDGRQFINHRGEKLFKAFHSRDNRALRELVASGYRVIIVTADAWEGAKQYAEKNGCEILIARDKSNLPFDNYIAVGDDAWDVPMLKRAVLAFAPADCDSSVRALANIQLLNTKGGCGVVAELACLLIKSEE